MMHGFGVTIKFFVLSSPICLYVFIYIKQMTRLNFVISYKKSSPFFHFKSSKFNCVRFCSFNSWTYESRYRKKLEKDIYMIFSLYYENVLSKKDFFQFFFLIEDKFIFFVIFLLLRRIYTAKIKEYRYRQEQFSLLELIWMDGTMA